VGALVFFVVTATVFGALYRKLTASAAPPEVTAA
jgi:hypothetical protein